MRHRTHPPDHQPPLHKRLRKHNKKNPRGSYPSDSTPLALLVACFILIFLSTWLLIHFLPRHTGATPFLRAMVEPGHLRSLSVSDAGTKEQEQLVIYPVEFSKLNDTKIPIVASQNHIIITHGSNRVPTINQDRAVMIPSYCNIYSRRSTSDNFFIGLFDGHDDKGHEIAQFASEEIPSRISNQIQNLVKEGEKSALTNKHMRQIIIDAFTSVDHNAPRIAGGCTAMAVIRIGSKVHMANTGDSTQFIAVYHPPSSQLDKTKSIYNKNYVQNLTRSNQRELQLQGTIKIHYQNKKHKANFPEEKSRIESLGGRIHIPPTHPMGSRVIARSATHKEDVGLAMSRSIGDWEWTQIGVIPDPDVQIVDLNEFWRENSINDNDKVFVVLGSDGLFDVRRVEFVAKHLAYGFFEQQKTIDNSESRYQFSNQMIDVGKKVVNMASPFKPEWHRDDITFVAKVVELRR